VVRGVDWQRLVVPAAAEWRADAEEVERLAWAGVRAWGRVKEHFPEPEIEQSYECTRGELTLTGHIDVSSVVGSEFRVLDWKSGREDASAEEQMRGYCWLGVTESRLDSATAVVVRLREMTQDVHRWTREELDGWFVGVVRDTADTARYAAGRHCGFCPRAGECQALEQHTSNAVAQLVDPSAALMEHPPEALLALYDRVKLVRGACDQAGDLLRAEVEARGGSVTASDGRTLYLRDETRRVIDPRSAWPILEERFGLDDLLGAVRIVKGDVEDLAKAAAPPRGKGAAVKALFEELDATGAMIETTVQKLEVRRNGNGNPTGTPQLAGGPGGGGTGSPG
jgi:hypothetical protein